MNIKDSTTIISNKIELSEKLKYTKFFLLIVAICIPFYIAFFETKIGKDLGGISFNLLFLSLVIGPLSKIFRENIGGKIFRFLLSIRGEIGILMASTAIAHGLSFMLNPYFQKSMQNPEAKFLDMLPIALGFWAMLLTIPLLITSNIYLKDKMGKWWYRLHKLAYAIFILGALHGSFIKGGVSVQNSLSAIYYFVAYGLIIVASKKLEKK